MAMISSRKTGTRCVGNARFTHERYLAPNRVALRLLEPIKLSFTPRKGLRRMRQQTHG